MATVTLAVQDIGKSGLTATYTASGASPLLNTADTFIFQNTGKEYVIFQKTGVAACTVTFDTPGTVDGLAIAQRTITVAAGSGDAIATTTFVVCPLLQPSLYNSPGSVMLSGFTVSEVAGLSVRIVRG